MQAEATQNTGHRERLKQRFLSGDAESRTDAALLELLLTFAIPQRDVRPLAERLLARFTDLEGVLSAPQTELLSVKGLGNHTITLLKLAGEIGLRSDRADRAAVISDGAATLDGPLGGRAQPGDREKHDFQDHDLVAPVEQPPLLGLHALDGQLAPNGPEDAGINGAPGEADVGALGEVTAEAHAGALGVSTGEVDARAEPGESEGRHAHTPDHPEPAPVAADRAGGKSQRPRSGLFSNALLR